MSHPSEDLSEQIEKLVRAHVEATRRAAAAAVERAFWSAAASRTRTRTRREARRPASSSASNRRSPTELSALSERLHAAVCAEPGRTMSMLAVEVGATARELHRPMKALKGAGRVRSVGQRHQTRYYPAVA